MRRTVPCTFLITPTDVAVLFTFLCLVALLVHDTPAIGTEQYAGKQTHLVISVRAFALFPKFLHTLPCFGIKYRLMRIFKQHLFFFGIVHA